MVPDKTIRILYSFALHQTSLHGWTYRSLDVNKPDYVQEKFVNLREEKDSREDGMVQFPQSGLGRSLLSLLCIRRDEWRVQARCLILLVLNLCLVLLGLL